ncbi:hypothetical protein PHLCEN_2v10721 [Hermanssonia centrifuga]|uniref:Uncharacterized protein n=1 Tax=Hermanssonia centrifuga TaxID=98765 RepID=A0A2R6NM62_9APHY|nr:hypothetical protein PHLCEN_2v10721 [Hermanssonia centrifuga]
MFARPSAEKANKTSKENHAPSATGAGRSVPGTSRNGPKPTALTGSKSTELYKINKDAPQSISGNLGASTARSSPIARGQHNQAFPTPKSRNNPSPSSGPSSSQKLTISHPTDHRTVAGPSNAPDTLQAAAQMYSWTYMTSAVSELLSSTEISTLNTLATRDKDLAVEEDKIKDARLRFDAKSILEFIEELTDDGLLEFPALFHAFLKQGECTKDLLAKVLFLSEGGEDSNDSSLLRRCNTILDSIGAFADSNMDKTASCVPDSFLECLEEETTQMAYQIRSLQSAPWPSSDSMLHLLLQTMSSVIQSRAENLSCAYAVIATFKERIHLQASMDSLVP